MNLQKSKNLPLQTLLFSCLKFVSSGIRCAVKILKDFTEGNSRLSQIKPQKGKKKHICLSIYNSRLKPMILTEIIEKHLFNHRLLHVMKTNAKTAFTS